MITRRSFCTALGLSLLSTNVLAEHISKTFDTRPNGTLTLRTEAGSVEVTTHAENTINIEIDIHNTDNEFSVSFENNDDGLSIEGERDGNWHSSSLDVQYQITLPSQYNVDLDTAGGDIQIANLNGRVEARTSGGKISTKDITGNINIKTSGGSLELVNVQGRIDGHTSGGNIDLLLHSQPDQAIRLHTSGGSIMAKFAENSRIDLKANTSGGRVSSQWQVDGSQSEQQIAGKINDGGPEVDLNTSGGSIYVEKIQRF